jgi:hypothetical protein
MEDEIIRQSEEKGSAKKKMMYSANPFPGLMNEDTPPESQFDASSG